MCLPAKVLDITHFFSDIAVGVISGLGAEGYNAAFNFAANQLNN
jgi:3-dehydroquinate dehydratase